MYLSYSETNTLDFSSNNISKLYSKGNLFTRKTKGNLYQTRSLRIVLSRFELNSENRRILLKNELLTLNLENLPMVKYSYLIHLTGKEFYTRKFGDLTFSAAKIKELLTDKEKSNLNILFKYAFSATDPKLPELQTLAEINNAIGYAICYQNNELLHYAYPFYDLKISKDQNLGMGMMLKAILWARENKKKYVYLGSIVEPSSKYKLQFSGLEWWDNQKQKWSEDLEEVKKLISVETNVT